MVIYKSSVEQRAKDRDGQLWEHGSVWVGAVQSCQILTPPLRKKPKKKKRSIAKKPKKKRCRERQGTCHGAVECQEVGSTGPGPRA